MNRTEALKRLGGLGTPWFTTSDIAVALNLTGGAASKVANRLAADGFLVHLARNRWAMPDAIRPFTLPEHLTAPYPAYISLQTALFHYGMISQIPHVVYAVTLAKPRRWTTPRGVVSLHQVTPDFFFGFESGPDGAKMAWPEKALLDSFYLTPARSRLFARLPEVEIPRNFSKSRVRQIIARIADPRRRSLVQRRWDELRGKGNDSLSRVAP